MGEWHLEHCLIGQLIPPGGISRHFDDDRESVERGRCRRRGPTKCDGSLRKIKLGGISQDGTVGGPISRVTNQLTVPNAEAAFIARGLPKNRDQWTYLTSVGGAVEMGKTGFEHVVGGGAVACVSEFK